MVHCLAVLVAAPAQAEELLRRRPQWQSLYAYLQSMEVPKFPAEIDTQLADEGREIYNMTCAECHGRGLEGSEGPVGSTPNLAIVAAYAPDEFRTLMRTGEPRDGRELRLMGDMSRIRFSHLTDAEIDGLHTYLSTMGATTSD